MSSSRRKKTVVPASKKRKGASSSAGPTAKVCHPLLQFPRGPQEELFPILQARPLIAGRCIDWAIVEQIQLADSIQALLTTDPWELFFGIIEPTYLELAMELCSMFHLQTVMTNYDDLGTIQFHLGGLICQLRVPEFSATLLTRLQGGERAQTSSTPMTPTSYGACHTTRLARHFGLLNTAAQESSLTLIDQMSPQGISNMLSMRMIERRRGSYPPQYRLAQFTEEEAYEDIPDDVPPQHEDPPTQPPPLSYPVHAAASYADISEHLTRFEQQCFQRFDNIDATLHQICQHLHISSPVPPREPSSDEDSSKAHHRIGTKNSTGKGSPRLPCPRP
ncbi:hypothetical protein GOBAR_AA04270 [Gossypium barbadense]|uniref:Uncharacterized protein n=1 Tax=Gossypium barbadense TaxID=3634 RepID=A0A2P5YL32_GOSBA|nr:hypothetical protein GOBAR_AA04270 [Gossypium barbadense]